jgi:hypothetical protein
MARTKSTSEVEKALEVIRRHRRPGTETIGEKSKRLLAERGPLPADEPSFWFPLTGMPEPWTAIARYVLRDGRVVIRDLYIGARGEHDIAPEGITSTLLRRIHTQKAPSFQEEAAELFREAGAPIAPRVRAAARRRHQRVTDDEVAMFALDYLTAVRRAPARPRAWLREDYERRGRHVTDGQMRDRIRQAADRGFLTEADGPGDRRPRRETNQLREWRESRTARRRRKK